MNEIIAEKLWSVAGPILQKAKGTVGRPEFEARKAFFGILYVLENGIKWRNLPAEYGKPTTVHGKFIKWTKEGKMRKVFEETRKIYMLKTDAFKNWYTADTSSCKAPYAKCGGKNPTDRSKRGIKKNIAVDSRGAPLAVDIAPANQHDSKTLEQVVNQINTFKQPGLSIVAVDSAYDSKQLQKKLLAQGLVLHSASNKRRNKKKDIVIPKGRWIVEAVHSWLNNFRALKICYAKNYESILSFLHIALSALLFKKILIFG